MKKTEKYEEFVQAMLKYDFLNPIAAYEGNWVFSDKIEFTDPHYDIQKDILYLNAKKDKKGKNMFEELLNRTFYNGLIDDRIKNNPHLFPAIYPLLKSEERPDRKGRMLSYTYALTLKNLKQGSGLKLKNDYKSMNTIEGEIKQVEELRKNVVEMRNHFASIAKEGVNSPYFEEGKELEKRVGCSINFSKQIELYNDLIFLVRNIKANLLDIKEGKRNNTIDLEQFASCYDFDTMLLMLSKCILSNAKIFSVYNATYLLGIIEVKQYISIVKTAGLEGYNPTIRYYDEKTNKFARYSFLELCRDFNQFQIKHPEFSTFEISMDNIDKLEVSRDIDASIKLAKVYSEQSIKTLKADWEILPAGEKEKNKQVASYTEKEAKSYIDKKKKDFKSVTTLEDIVFRKYIYEKTNYVLKIVGKEDFSGYVGYVYENGEIFFERFYEDEEQKIPAQNRATCVMNFDTFFKKLTRKEFLELVNSTNDPAICRLYHTPTWHNRLMKKIESIDYTEESKMLIESLLQEKHLRKELR